MKLNHACSIFFIFVTGFCGAEVAVGNDGPQLAAEKRTMDRHDWPKFLGPSGDGKSTEKNILTDWTNGKLQLRWKIETGEGYAMGSVAKGRFYHFILLVF